MRNIFLVFIGGVFVVLLIVYCKTRQEQRNEARKTHLQTQLFYLQSIQSGVKQAFESYKIITQSTNLETVKSRYDFLLQSLKNTLSVFDKLDNQHDVKEDKSALESLQKTLVEDKEKLMKQAVYNAFQAEMIEISKLKTATGKIRRQDRFYKKVSSIFPEQESYVRDLIGYDVFGK
jgi:ribosome-binding ATPase YchF (GTP1/OBG family)